MAWLRSVMIGGALYLATLVPTALAPAHAEALDADARTAIVSVITEQLAAFRRDDGAAAFSFASPGIQRLFGTPERFMAMVRQGYRPVYRPQSVQFLDLVPDRGRWIQRVFLIGPDGAPVIALYFMERQPDGQWRISGCELTVADDRPA